MWRFWSDVLGDASWIWPRSRMTALSCSSTVRRIEQRVAGALSGPRLPRTAPARTRCRRCRPGRGGAQPPAHVVGGQRVLAREQLVGADEQDHATARRRPRRPGVVPLLRHAQARRQPLRRQGDALVGAGRRALGLASAGQRRRAPREGPPPSCARRGSRRACWRRRRAAESRIHPGSASSRAPPGSTISRLDDSACTCLRRKCMSVSRRPQISSIRVDTARSSPSPPR